MMLAQDKLNSFEINLKELKGSIITILLPTYNDWESIFHLLPKIDTVLDPIEAKIKVVIVDDGSTDVTGKDKIPELKFKSIIEIQEINLIRNQGNQAAISIGASYVAENITTDFLIIMDSDHEDKPEDILKLLTHCETVKRKKIIFAERTIRSEGLLFKLMYKLYKLIFKFSTGNKISFGNFCIVPNSALKPIVNIPEIRSHFSIGIMRSRIPYEKIPTVRGKRISGKSSMNLINLIGHAFNGLAIYSDIISIRLLIATIFASVFIFFGIVTTVFLRIYTDIFISGWSSVIIGILCLLLVQILIGSLSLNFIVSLNKLKLPNIPIHSYKNYILCINNYF